MKMRKLMRTRKANMIMALWVDYIKRGQLKTVTSRFCRKILGNHKLSSCYRQIFKLTLPKYKYEWNYDSHAQFRSNLRWDPSQLARIIIIFGGLITKWNLKDFKDDIGIQSALSKIYWGFPANLSICYRESISYSFIHTI